MLPSLLITRAIGRADNVNPVFDDLKEETIGKIVKIKLWVGKARIFAIETSYKLVNDDYHMTQTHGRKVGTTVKFEVTRSQIFIGLSGAVSGDEDDPGLKRLGFLIFDTRSGELLVKNASAFSASKSFFLGPQPIKSDSSTKGSVKGFLALGRIIGFSGSLYPDGTLASIAAYKLEPGNRETYEETVEISETGGRPANALHLQGECWLSTT